MNTHFLPSFRDVWDLGYHDLVPVEPRTKAVLLKGWQHHITTLTDLDCWQGQGKGIGIRTGRSLIGDDVLVGIDADTLDEVLATEIYSTLTEITGYSELQLISRIGNWPKQMFLFAKDGGGLGAIGGKITFGGSNGSKPDEVEVRANWQQFVGFGIHPVTGRPYRWPNGFPPVRELPRIGQDQIDTFMDLMRERLPKARGRVGAGKPAADQESLKGEAGRIQAALAFIDNKRTTQLPNGAELDYHGWVQMAYALKAALGDGGWPLFERFSAGWQDGACDPRTTAATWKGAKGPFRVGASWIFETAAINSNGLFSKDGKADAGNGQSSGNTGGSTTDSPPQPLPTTTIGARASEALEPREFLDGHNFVLVGAANVLSGDGGIGKTDIACQMSIAVHPDSKMKLFGLPPRLQGPVLFFSAEEPEAELRRRIHAICEAEAIDPGVLTSLHIVDYSRKEAWLFREDRTGLLITTPLWDALKATAAAIKPALILVDNRARVVAGNQNSAILATSAITHFDCLAFDHHCAVELLSHVSLSQISSGRGDSGSVAWANAGRARCFFRHPDDERDASSDDDGKRILVSMKSNYSKPGKQVEFRWDEDGHTFRCAWQPPKADDGIGAQDKAERVFLRLLELHNRQKIRVSAAPMARAMYAPQVFAGHPQNERVTVKMFKNAMAALLESERIKQMSYGAKSRAAVHLVVDEKYNF